MHSIVSRKSSLPMLIRKRSVLWGALMLIASACKKGGKLEDKMNLEGKVSVSQDEDSIHFPIQCVGLSPCTSMIEMYGKRRQ